MIKVMVLDDEMSAIRRIRKTIKETLKNEDINVISFTSISECMSYAIKNRDIDIACIDITLNDMLDGIYVAKRLKIINYRTLIIFISVRVDCFEQMVNAEPFRFVIKGNLSNQLPFAINAALRRINKCQEYFSYEFERQRHKLAIDDIVYFYSGDHRYIYAKLIDGTTKKFIEKMDALEKQIKTFSNKFIRANKSFIVNPEHIDWENEKDIHIDDITISKTQFYHIIF